MKLYYSPGACSLSPHIVACELGLDLTLEKVDNATKQTQSGRDFLTITSKGYVPALEFDDGSILTEGTAIVQYLADQRPDAKLIPANGTMARYRMQEMLGYINSEIHKTFGGLFNPKVSAEQRADAVAHLRKRYAMLDAQLAKGPYLFGEDFSVADAYLFTVTNWAGYVKVDLSEFGNLTAFQARVAARPAVKAAMSAEGLGAAS